MAIHLDNMPTSPVQSAFRTIFGRRLAEFTAPLPGAEHGRARDIHKARVASRRLREMLPLMRTGRRRDQRVRKLMRRVTRGLGRLREAEVLVELLDSVPDPAHTRVGVRRLREHLVADRETAFKKRKRKRLGRTFRRAVRQLARLPDAWAARGASVERQWRRAMEARIARRARGLLQAMDDAGVDAAPDLVHRVRIAAKKLRYVVELSEQVAGVPSSKELRRLVRAQSLLGRLHDRQVLLDAGADVRASLEPRDLRSRKDLRDLASDLEARCQALHESYLQSRRTLHGVCQSLLTRARARLT